MPLRVKLQDVVEAIDLPNGDWQSYVNRQTGAIVTVSDDMVIGPDDQELNRADVEDSDEYLPLPTSFEIDEWSIMKKFADERPDPLGSEVLEALSGRGAFRMFRAALKRLRIEDEWSLSRTGIRGDRHGVARRARHRV